MINEVLLLANFTHFRCHLKVLAIQALQIDTEKNLLQLTCLLWNNLCVTSYSEWPDLFSWITQVSKFFGINPLPPPTPPRIEEHLLVFVGIYEHCSCTTRIRTRINFTQSYTKQLSVKFSLIWKLSITIA